MIQKTVRSFFETFMLMGHRPHYFNMKGNQGKCVVVILDVKNLSHVHKSFARVIKVGENSQARLRMMNNH